MKIWRVISESGIENEENFPDDLIQKFNGCKLYLRFNFVFLVSHYEISNIVTDDDSNDLQNKKNQLNTLDANNETLHQTLEPQTLNSTPNTVTITHNTITISHQATNMYSSSNFLGSNHNTLAQGLS